MALAVTISLLLVRIMSNSASIYVFILVIILTYNFTGYIIHNTLAENVEFAVLNKLLNI